MNRNKAGKASESASLFALAWWLKAAKHFRDSMGSRSRPVTPARPDYDFVGYECAWQKEKEVEKETRPVGSTAAPHARSGATVLDDDDY